MKSNRTVDSSGSGTRTSHVEYATGVLANAADEVEFPDPDGHLRSALIDAVLSENWHAATYYALAALGGFQGDES